MLAAQWNQLEVARKRRYDEIRDSIDENDHSKKVVPTILVTSGGYCMFE